MEQIWNDSLDEMLQFSRKGMVTIPNAHHPQLQVFSSPANVLPPFAGLNDLQQQQMGIQRRVGQHISAGFMNANGNQGDRPPLPTLPQNHIRKTPHRNPTQREIHILSERQRREEMNEKFAILRSILPKLNKKDKASVVSHTIKHLAELEEKVRHLRSCCKNKRQTKTECASSSNTPKLGKHSTRTGPQLQGGGVVEFQDMGSCVLIKMDCRWNPTLLLKTCKALQDSEANILQCFLSKHGTNAIYILTVELDRTISNRMEKLMACLQAAVAS